MSAMNQERLLKVILAPVISEKSTRLADNNNQITFRVMGDATKHEIGAAVAMLFNPSSFRHCFNVLKGIRSLGVTAYQNTLPWSKVRINFVGLFYSCTL